MIELYKTIDDKLCEVESIDDGVWMNIINPSNDEIVEVCSTLRIDEDFVRAALDDEERPRLEHEDGTTLILVDIPLVEVEKNAFMYTTMPMGIIMHEKMIITVCLKKSPLINDFIEERVKSFYTYKRSRFILQLLYKNAILYLQYLKQIDKMSNKIEHELHKSTQNKELILLLNLEKSLVYFSTSLKSNEVVLEKLLRFEYIKQYPDDVELLEDVIIENKQAIEMANIYSSVLSGTMDAFASVISNNQNDIMKVLTIITIVMAIPNIIAGLFGMNVMLPFTEANPYAFYIILGITAAASALIAYIFYKKNLF